MSLSNYVTIISHCGISLPYIPNMNPPKQKSIGIKGTKCKVDLLKRGNKKKGDIKISHRKRGKKKSSGNRKAQKYKVQGKYNGKWRDTNCFNTLKSHSLFFKTSVVFVVMKICRLKLILHDFK